jgi:hypothetical protein
MQAAESPRRARRIYTLKADEAIFAAFARYPFLTAEQGALITGRPLKTLQQRFQYFVEAGMLNRVRQTDKFSLREPYVYFLDKDGAKRACDLGELQTPRYITSKSRMIVNHDLEITKFHLAVESAATFPLEGTATPIS